LNAADKLDRQKAQSSENAKNTQICIALIQGDPLIDDRGTGALLRFH
jgi:hypothetical protein